MLVKAVQLYRKLDRSLTLVIEASGVRSILVKAVQLYRKPDKSVTDLLFANEEISIKLSLGQSLQKSCRLFTLM